MKYLLILIILLSNFSCNDDSKKIHASDLAEFSNLKVEFITGDESITSHRIDIIKDSDKIIATKKRPLYYYGSKTDSIWTTEINQSDLDFIKTFIARAKKQKDSCSLLSSSIDYYDIEIGGNKKIKIIGNCEWNGIDYDSLEQRLFYRKFNELKNKRTLLTDSLANSFIGIWRVSGWENGALINKDVNLTRLAKNEPKNKEKTYWTIENPTELKKYIYIINGRFIEIRGSNYEIKKIKSDRIELRFRW